MLILFVSGAGQRLLPLRARICSASERPGSVSRPFEPRG
jgi:hypothetical protein